MCTLGTKATAVLATVKRAVATKKDRGDAAGGRLVDDNDREDDAPDPDGDARAKTPLTSPTHFAHSLRPVTLRRPYWRRPY